MKLYGLEEVEKWIMECDSVGIVPDFAKQLADAMRELDSVKAQIIEDKLCNKEVIDSIMRENQELRQCLEAFYFDTMYKDSPVLHDIACKLLAPYSEEFAQTHRSKHRLESK